jgi:hypothetical protein
MKLRIKRLIIASDKLFNFLFFNFIIKFVLIFYLEFAITSLINIEAVIIFILKTYHRYHLNQTRKLWDHSLV